MAQGDESPNSSAKDVINIFSQVQFSVPNVERSLGFTHDYTLPSLLAASRALGWIWEEGFTNTIAKPRPAGSPARVGGEEVLRRYLLANKEVAFPRCP